MNHRERIRKALNHETSGGVPIDFGSSAVTGMHVTCVRDLRDYYGLESRPVSVIEPYQMLGRIDDDLSDVLGIDTRGLLPHATMFGFPNQGWKEYRLPWGQAVLVPGRFRTVEDAKGDLLIFPEGDTAAPPSGRMPAGGFFFDTIIRQENFDEEHLRVEDNLEEFTPLPEEALRYYEAESRRLEPTGRGVLASFSGTAIGDIALVSAPFLKHPKGIRDIEEWYVSTLVRRDHLHKIFTRQCDIALENLARIFAVTGNAIDAVFVCGTDFGTQTSSFCSPATFDELYLPYYRRLNDWIHANTAWKTFKHSCGAVEPFMAHFIDAGFDIINPVQCSAKGMDPARLKERYGERLVFWGGGVDTQSVLPFGTPADVRRQVLERCAIFSAGGGFVFTAVHNLQAGTPVENIAAMFDAVKEFNGIR
jgi:hypothetical protein